MFRTLMVAAAIASLPGWARADTVGSEYVNVIAKHAPGDGITVPHFHQTGDSATLDPHDPLALDEQVFLSFDLTSHTSVVLADLKIAYVRDRPDHTGSTTFAVSVFADDGVSQTTDYDAAMTPVGTFDAFGSGGHPSFLVTDIVNDLLDNGVTHLGVRLVLIDSVDHIRITGGSLNHRGGSLTSSVPEPFGLAMLGFAALGMAVRRRRRTA